MLSITRNTVNDFISNRVDDIVRVIGLGLLPVLSQMRCYLHPLCFVSGGHSPAGLKRSAYEPASAKPSAPWAWTTQTTTTWRPSRPQIQLG